MNKNVGKYVLITGIIGLFVALMFGQLDLDFFDLVGIILYFVSQKLGGYLQWIFQIIGLVIVGIVTLFVIVVAVLGIALLSVVL